MYQEPLEVVDYSSFVNKLKGNHQEVSSEDNNKTDKKKEPLDELEDSLERIRKLTEGLLRKCAR